MRSTLRISSLLIMFGCVLVVGQGGMKEVSAFCPVDFLLLKNKSSGSQPLTHIGLSAGQESANGGRRYFYDIHTMIDGGPPVFLGAVPSGFVDKLDSGYLFNFNPQTGHSYSFQATASDSKGVKGNPSGWSPSFSLPVETETESYSSPVADPGLPQLVQVGTEIVLDGSGSYMPKTNSNSDLTYRWECYSASNAVPMSGLDTMHPSFTPTEAGTYKFRLIVSSQQGDVKNESAIRYVHAHAVEDLASAHIASVGVPSQVPLGDKIVLDGSLSKPTPENGGFYHWELINREELTTTAEITNSTSPVASLTADSVGAHMFRLTVITAEEYKYRMVMVSVYDSATVGPLVEQDISGRSELDCTIADLNEDSVVDAADLSLIQSAMDSGRGERAYVKVADFDRDLRLTSRDRKVIDKCLGTVLR